MNTRGWDERDRAEFHAACAEAWDEGSTTRERSAALRDKVRDGVQAHRPWAYRVEDEALGRGITSVLNRWNKAHNQVLVSYEGEVIAKPRVVGTSRTDDAGNRFSTQVLFDAMTWAELEAKREEFLRQVRAYTQNVATIDRLLALRSLVPSASSPGDAAAKLGTTVEAWLLGEEVA